MNIPRSIASTALVALVTITACEEKSGSAATKAAPTSPMTDAKAKGAAATPPAPAPDNTASNKGDGSGDAKTPLDQSDSPAHIKITADIRRAIMDDKTMSMNAQNCKIITDKSGKVTLRGVVDTQAEKDSIGAKAQAIAGPAMVDNQLEVKAG